MSMAGIGERQHQGADVHSCDQRQYRCKRHVAIVRPLIISPAYMHPDPVARDVAQRRVDGRNHALDEIEKIGLRTILKRNVVLEREIGAIELKQKALRGYRLVFDLQGAADGSFDRDLAVDSPGAEEFFAKLKRALVTGYFVEELGSGKLATELDRLDLIDEYHFLVQPRIAGHGPTLYQSGLPSTRRLELISAAPLRNGAVAMHYRRERG